MLRVRLLSFQTASMSLGKVRIYEFLRSVNLILTFRKPDLNASMRRIDLFCKLIAPVVISFVDSYSTRVAIWAVLGLNTASVLVEYVAIAQVYRAVPALKRVPAPICQDAMEDEDEDQAAQLDGSSSQRLSSYIRETLAPWKEYVASPVFLASFALSLLYLTVLSFGATMVTYLLQSGFSSLEVSFMRIGSVAAEISGTWTAPIVMRRIGPIRSGLWFLNWQVCCVAGASVAFVFWDSTSKIVAGSLIVGVALSRIGLWGFDLSAQFLVQEVSYIRLLSRIDANPPISRTWRNMPGHDSQQPRWRFRISSRCSRLLLLSSSLGQKSFSIQ